MIIRRVCLMVAQYSPFGKDATKRHYNNTIYPRQALHELDDV